MELYLTGLKLDTTKLYTLRGRVVYLAFNANGVAEDMVYRDSYEIDYTDVLVYSLVDWRKDELKAL